MNNQRIHPVGILTVLVTLAAATTTAWRLLSSSSPAPAVARSIGDWRTYSEAGLRVGADDANVTVTEFLDFRCPICARAVSYLRELREREGRNIAIVYRHLPIAPGSWEAASVAYCAGLVGHFLEVQDYLFRTDATAPDGGWIALADTLGIADVRSFEACLTSRDTRAAIEADTVAARRLEVIGTPTFLVNDQLVSGFLGGAVMDSIVASVRQ